MARRNRQEAAVVKRYAQENGIALRTAQLHAQQQNPKFQEYLRRQAAVASQAMTARDEAVAMLGGSIVAAASEVTNELDRARNVEEEAYQSLCAIQRLKQAAIQTVDPNLQSIITSQIAAQKCYNDAHRSRRQAEQAAGAMVSVSEFEEINRRFVGPCRELMKTMPVEVAGMVPAFDSDALRTACEAWRDQQFYPRLEALAAEIAKRVEAAKGGGDG